MLQSFRPFASLSYAERMEEPLPELVHYPVVGGPFLGVLRLCEGHLVLSLTVLVRIDYHDAAAVEVAVYLLRELLQSVLV